MASQAPASVQPAALSTSISRSACSAASSFFTFFLDAASVIFMPLIFLPAHSVMSPPLVELSCTKPRQHTSFWLKVQAKMSLYQAGLPSVLQHVCLSLQEKPSGLCQD